MAEQENKQNVKNKVSTGLKAIFGNVDSRTGNFILAIIVIVLLNFAGLFFSVRFDLSQSGAFSLSPVSKKIVRSLEEPLSIKVFFSNDLPAEYSSVQRYLFDLLEEYDRAAGSNFRVEIVDVDDEKGKQTASSYGISPVQVREVASDQIKQRASYMGIVLIHGELVEKMNEVTTPEGLEYKITNTITKMIGKSDALLAAKDPVRVTLYVSDELKNFGIQGFEKINDTVRASFDKVNDDNYGKLSYNAIDPSVKKESMAVAGKYGIQAIKWKTTVLPDGKRIPEGEGLLAIVVEYGSRFQVIPLRIQPTIFRRYVIGGLDQLNDSLNGAVSAVLSHNPVVGYAAGHNERPLADERMGAANFRALMQEGYEVREIDLGKDEIPLEMKTLIVNGPKTAYPAEDLYKIDQFMMRGGNVLFFVDAFNEMRTQSRNPMQQSTFVPVDSGLEKILSGLGVAVNMDYALDMKCFVNRGENGDTPFYFVPVLEKKSLSDNSVITRYMNKMIFIKASTLTLNSSQQTKAGLKATTLLSTSDKAWKMQGQINLIPFMIQPPAEKEMKQYPLAVMIEGKFRSAFDGVRPVPTDPKKVKPLVDGAITETALKQSAKDGIAVVIGTSEVTSGEVVDTEGRFPNGAFLMNIIDYMNGRTDTPEMRSKGLAFNPLDVTTETTRYLVKGINMFFVPFIAVIVGLIVWRRRAVKHKKIKAAFSSEETHE